MAASDESDREDDDPQPPQPPQPPPPPLPPQPPPLGDDGGGAAQAAFDDAVRVDLLRRGERYLVFAPAADRSVGLDGRFVGFLSEVEQAGIGVLSIAPHGRHAEFRRLSVDLDGSSRTYRGVRDVELEELGGFCFERKLCPGRAPVPDVANDLIKRLFEV